MSDKSAHHTLSVLLAVVNLLKHSNMWLFLMKNKVTPADAGEDTSSFSPSLFPLSWPVSSISEKSGGAVTADGETSDRLSEEYL